ncbi:MAG: hypothetical protein HUU02_07565 [Bacteroidetes bacterium]|nr:hypothetical protein [Bacteroidota bacterium]
MAALFTFLLIFLQSLPDGPLIVESFERLFRHVGAAAITADERLLVTDTELHTVSVIGPDNTVLETIGTKGWGNDAFDWPVDISSTFLLEVLVTDRMNERVQHFDRSLVYVQTVDRTSLGSSPPLHPVASVQSRQGDLYILDEEQNAVLVTGQRGTVRGTFTAGGRTFTAPKDIVVTMDDRLFVLDGEGIHQFDLFGNYAGLLRITGNDPWESISESAGKLVLVSPSMILVKDLESGAEQRIKPSDLIGTTVTEPFRTALLTRQGIIVLTPTTLYRCSFPGITR